MKRLTKIIGATAGGVAALLGALWAFSPDDQAAAPFRTARVTKGDLVSTIEATGTLEPEDVIDVGAQVGGKIISFGVDANGKPIDYSSPVEAGMVLAKIDDALYQASVTEAQAQVAASKASLQSARADLEQLKAKFRQAERDWQRARKLGPSEAISQASFDSYQSAFEAAKANVTVGEAAILQAKASLAQAEAALWRAQRNLDYCTITSPVKGVIIDRRVDIGQTVNSSMSAPSLFLIAKDLTKMELWVAVNEADIGSIHPGQKVSFTVDAFPGHDFSGQVGKLRLNASMTQNVVSYTVEVQTDNSDGKLLPYLTANVLFEKQRQDGALLAPNAALRFTPADESISPDFREPQKQDQPGAHAGGQGKRGVIWVPDGAYARPLKVKVGVSDGTHTAISGPDLSEGMSVIVGGGSQGARTQSAAASQSDGAASPFTPKMPRRPGGGGPPH
ncbi:efflux transporter, RND family, MFP subunit [Desulfarculus baarsii DSM 2075]|uniref:Efflux transporter, RND family, MFP subunit n=1 Tax=Desulfarculus baarsii (strain ATCC 33931 / DSM 2075 / LMG 7858 / VKM B-1802 / 2st14) TaxID=644282 RepID=E1QHH0_DESB2|nr:efflux RND transporter periplasmic adaptor subunit [Desulfarculus baarsii]ADK85013.1 efflux transporter, RND family, MFP subunit [Desulfarculus baarsii DSM 2075]